MKNLGLLGKDISHSKSQQMYEELLGEAVDYTLFDFPLASAVPKLDYLLEKVQGLSITTPYKKHFLSEVIIEKEIKELDAINCIKKSKTCFKATNTDYSAIKELLLSQEYNLYEYEVVILGNGVMSRVVQRALAVINFHEFKVLSRAEYGPLENFELVEEKSPLLVINACDRSFTFAGELPASTFFWDLNYDFSPHKYLANKVEKYIDGLPLLKLQAEHALKFWNIED